MNFLKRTCFLFNTLLIQSQEKDQIIEAEEDRVKFINLNDPNSLKKGELLFEDLRRQILKKFDIIEQTSKINFKKEYSKKKKDKEKKKYFYYQLNLEMIWISKNLVRKPSFTIFGSKIETTQKLLI